MARARTATAQLKLRLREELRKRIEAAAKKEKRSLNEELVRRLEESFRRADAEALLAGVAQLLAKQAGWSKDAGELLAEIRAGRAGQPINALVPTSADPLAERLKAEHRRRGRDEGSALEAESLTRKAELVVLARHLSGNPNMLVDEALVYLAKRGNEEAKAVLNERGKRLEESAPRKPLKRA